MGKRARLKTATRILIIRNRIVRAARKNMASAGNIDTGNIERENERSI